MNMSPSKKFQINNDLNIDINNLVKNASFVITPYGPISAFAARHPWAGMENQTFEQVARRLRLGHDVDILPNEALLQAAKQNGDIDQDHLRAGLKEWLDEQSLEIPWEEQEHYCWSLLLQEKSSNDEIQVHQVKSVVKSLKRSSSQIFEHRPVQTYCQRLERINGDRTGENLNVLVIKWCKLFFDEGKTTWAMPHRNEGLYAAWRKLIPHDPSLDRMIRDRLNDLPEESEQALMHALAELDIPQAVMQEYLEAHLLSLPGWAGMILWNCQKSRNDSLLTDYLAIRVILEAAMLAPFLPLKEDRESNDDAILENSIVSWSKWGGMPVHLWNHISVKEQQARLTLAYRFDEVLRQLLWLKAWEKTYEDHLKALIIPNQQTEPISHPPMAQFAFCIDVRSEPFRRALEGAGPFETYGTAGFFGLPIETYKLGSRHGHPSLPVMLEAQVKIKETLNKREFQAYRRRLNVAGSTGQAFESMKHNLLTSLLLPEISGPWLTLRTLAASFIPRAAHNAFHKIHKKWLPQPDVTLTLDHSCDHDGGLPIGFTDEEKVLYARQALEMMGLTENFAPLVVICGHESQSINNPHATALDCSACGGASSAFNARVLATLCNLPTVRSALAGEGIVIPEETVFVAAKHLTTIDELSWIYVPELTAKAREAFEKIRSALPTMTLKAGNERLPELPAIGDQRKSLRAKAGRRAKDWSEVRPEWGLAKNAAFIIGKRELTKNCNLEGRVFLHNYNWESDKSGRLLANIIQGPGTVAQWINLQYYASTVAPHFYGSGNKMTQTVTSEIGVMQGNASDLLTGLPWQSVMAADDKAYHEPIRLLIVIQAPHEYIKCLLDGNREFKQKVRNGWVRLSSIDPEGNWKSWT